MATNLTFCLVSRACMAAPVPRPPHPTSATLIVSSTEELKSEALDASGIARRDPVNRADCFTNSLREAGVFIIIDFRGYCRRFINWLTFNLRIRGFFFFIKLLFLLPKMTRQSYK